MRVLLLREAEGKSGVHDLHGTDDSRIIRSYHIHDVWLSRNAIKTHKHIISGQGLLQSSSLQALKLLNVRPQINLMSEGRLRLSMEIPIRLSNLQNISLSQAT